MSLVLVHGGLHGSWCWDPVLPLLSSPAATVDLPGRGSRPADLASVTLADCVAAVVDEADGAGFDRFVLVGHSMGGITITETAFRHPDRIEHLVYVGALVPAPGQSAAEVMTGADLPAGEMTLPDEALARAMFGNDLDDDQWAVHWKGLVPDAAGIINARLSGYPTGIPMTYVNMTDDVPVPPDRAEQMAANLGPDVERRTIEAGHTVMLSQPQALAAILDEIAQRHA